MAETVTPFEATEQMFALVGRAITQWSFVEERLCSIFAICTSVTAGRPEGGVEYLDYYLPMCVFYSVENFRSKLGMLDAAITAGLMQTGEDKDEFTADWAKLREKTRKLSLKRNRLAHWTVLPASRDEDGIIPARFVPPYGSPGYFRETGWRPTSATMSISHLQNLELAFHLLSEKLAAFGFALARSEGLFGKSVRLMERQIRSLDQLDPNRAERIRHSLLFRDL